jgi:hypothetical protein
MIIPNEQIEHSPDIHRGDEKRERKYPDFAPGERSDRF